MSQLRHSATQSIVSAGVLLTRWQKMLCWRPLHGKGISNLRLRFCCGEKKCFRAMFEQNMRLDSKTSRC